jgi:TolA-binding protein
MAPNCRQALYGFGQLMASKGKHENAQELFGSIVAIEPTATKAWFKLGESLQAQGKFPEAAAAYNEVLAREPSFPGAYYHLGMAQLEMRRTDDAVLVRT